MKITAYNTYTKNKEILSESGKEFGMYCCGPTVYGPAHIGNFRTFLVQDALRRVLECAKVKVIHVRNITDVDDKTIRESRKLGMTLTAFTQKWTEKFHEDCSKLNMLQPSVEPKATEHIPEQIAMVKTLQDKGFAYATSDGSVYFKISAFADYGKLSNLDKENLATQTTNSAGSENLADEYERENVSDFALWKGAKPEDGENFWESPWGKGRPGWHIECSAMSKKYLGDAFDLHGGGIDLVFPHHENEIAQSECSSGVSPCVRHWFHSAHLMVESQKMSKSLGNLYTLDDLIAKNYTPNQVRFALLAGHYRQQLNFTFKGLDDAKSALTKLDKHLSLYLKELNISNAEFLNFINSNEKIEGTIFEKTFDALCDDLNIPKALGELFTAFSKTEKVSVADIKALGAVLYSFGIKPFESLEEKKVDAPAEIINLANRRIEAKKSKDFALADSLRAEITSLGWNILDTKAGYTLEKK